MGTVSDGSLAAILKLTAEAEKLAELAQEARRRTAVAQEAARAFPSPEALAALDSVARQAEAIGRSIAEVQEIARRLLPPGAPEAASAMKQKPLSPTLPPEVIAQFGSSAQEAARHVPSVEEIARFNAAATEAARHLPPPEVIAKLAEQRWRQAAEIAAALTGLQDEFQSLPPGQRRAAQRSLELLAFFLLDPEEMLAWLSRAHPDLGMRTPLDVIREGYADAVEGMLANALEGIPT